MDAHLLQQCVLFGDAVGDRLPLSGHAFTVQAHRLGLRLSLGDALDLVRLGEGLCGDAVTLCGVDRVHRIAHLRIRGDVSDQAAHDLESVALHRFREPALDVLRDVVLRLERSVQSQARQSRTNGVEDVRADLLLGVRQLVVRIGYVVLFDDVLDGDGNRDEDVVLRLRLDVDLELLNSQRDRPARRLDERHLRVQSRLRDLLELAESFDDDVLLRLHREEHARAQLPEQQDGDDENDDDNGDGDRHSTHDSSNGSWLSAVRRPLTPITLVVIECRVYDKAAGSRLEGGELITDASDVRRRLETQRGTTTGR